MAKKKYSKYFILYFVGLIITSIFIIIFVSLNGVISKNSNNSQNFEHNESNDIVDIDYTGTKEISS